MLGSGEEEWGEARLQGGGIGRGYALVKKDRVRLGTDEEECRETRLW
jgi:hypothetical protein